MIASLTSGLPFLGLAIMAIVIVGGILVLVALHTKGDVIAELSHGKTMFKINAKDRRESTKQ